MAAKMFITDFDGTLLGDDKNISREDWETLLRLRENGVIAAIATGRSLYSFEKALAALNVPGHENQPLPVDYVIFSTGAGILDFKTKKVMRSFSIPPEALPGITGTMDRLHLDYMVHQAIPHTRRFLYRQFDPENADFNCRLAFYPEYARVLPEKYPYTDPATEVLAIIPPERAGEALIRELSAGLSGFSVIRATSPLDHRSVWIEVFHPEVSKSGAAAWLAGQLAMSASDIVAVGNDYNDEDLLAWAGAGYAVENAPADLKGRFTPVAANSRGGVSEAAACLLPGYSSS